jgi:zinc D-Ala-D-Ala carboxypeptidase
MKQYPHFSKVPKSAWRWKSFSPREIACKGTGSIAINEPALDKLQALRDKLGKPILLTSAYRSPEHNAKVGGAKNSQHMLGIAFDVRMENQDPQQFEAAARAVGFTGFGYYPKQGFMHIDTGAKRSWGTPFKISATGLAADEPKRGSVAQSTTVQASAVQIASSAGAGIAAVGALDGTAQIVAIALCFVVGLAAAWIMRERLKAWADGVK